MVLDVIDMCDDIHDDDVDCWWLRIVSISSPVDVTEGVCIGLSHERWKPLKLISWVNLEPQKHDIEQRFYDSSRTLILIDKGMDRYDSWQSCQWLSPNKKNHLRGECSKWPQPPTYQLVARFSHNLQPKSIKKIQLMSYLIFHHSKPH